MTLEKSPISFIKSSYPEKFEVLQKFPPTPEALCYVRRTILSKITSADLPRICSSTSYYNENVDKYNNKINIPFTRKKPKFYDLSLDDTIIQNSVLPKYNQLYSFMEQCIANGNSSSLLLIGPHHSGKTLLINNCLWELNERYNKHNIMPSFLTIHLDGILQTDDKSAVREIARQLDLKLCKIAKNNSSQNLLEDIYNEDESDNEDEKDGKQYTDNIFEKRSISETFSLILKSLEEINFKDNEDKSISLIFIIDNFEVFTDNNKQTLLYNLFDMSSNNYTVPISVIGSTTRVNIKELLEKRVSSRFSQRVINLFGSVNSNHKDYLVNYHVYSELEYFWFDLRYNLCLSEYEIHNIEDENIRYFGYLWNDLINDMFYEKDIARDFKFKLLENFITVKDMKLFLTNCCIYPICKINESMPFPTDRNFAKLDTINNFNFSTNNSKYDKLYNLVNNTFTDLQLLMMICACRVIVKLEINFINFNLCFEEYTKVMQKLSPNSGSENVFLENGKLKKRLAGNTGMVKQYNKMTCKNSWEFLVSFSIFVSAGDAGNTASNTVNSISGGNYQCNLDLADLNNKLEKNHKFKRLTVV